MIKIYGMPSCPYCAYVEKQIQNNPDFLYLDIGSDVHLLHEFLELRDHDPAFVPYKEEGDVGIPAFVLENGKVTIDPHEVGLKSLSDEKLKTTCSLDGKGC